MWGVFFFSFFVVTRCAAAPAFGVTDPNVPAVRTMTVQQYDLEKWHENAKQMAIQFVISMAIHWKWPTFVLPMLSQCLMGPLKVVGSELFLAHMLGEKIKRPFEAPKSPFGDLWKSVSGGGAAEEPREPREPKKPKPLASSSGTRLR